MSGAVRLTHTDIPPPPPKKKSATDFSTSKTPKSATRSPAEAVPPVVALAGVPLSKHAGH